LRISVVLAHAGLKLLLERLRIDVGASVEETTRQETLDILARGNKLSVGLERLLLQLRRNASAGITNEDQAADKRRMLAGHGDRDQTAAAIADHMRRGRAYGLHEIDDVFNVRGVLQQASR